ncbi:MAG TPA: 30S ribosomal protein S18 [Candidatus Paceibacterota bacterium]|nr:30S ribosomal protein S18 [Verrucomicrobiota bacterium]HRZ44729.1 30S ribosomal protein S18 [Candidatus Paceibacterota bacterium]HRZ91435.1 30S ribosomal protein S18 [Candidatus Paceibacterota bacterium]
MPRKTHTDRGKKTGSRRGGSDLRTSRPKPKVDFTVDALDFKNVNLLRQYVTDQGRILPRKYTGLPAHYQRRLGLAIKRARQLLLMK